MLSDMVEDFIVSFAYSHIGTRIAEVSSMLWHN
jgi:hypothetical protein